LASSIDADLIPRARGSAKSRYRVAMDTRSDEYKRLVAEEIEHYSQLYADPKAREQLQEPDPAVWLEVERRAGQRIRAVTGRHRDAHAIVHLHERPGANMLSLGSGPGGWELGLAEGLPDVEITCVDLNPDLMALGRERARELGRRVTFTPADLNLVELEPERYDLVACRASLHHVLELERLADQIHRCLRPGGLLWVDDVIAPNGFRMPPETREVVRPLFRSLPERLRYNHYWKKIDDEICEPEQEGMECIRSGEVRPVLDARFKPRFIVPRFALCRRFFDTVYGYNYDLERDEDRAIVDRIWTLDEESLASGALPPDSMFAIYER
jgi:ubiquinone/menaquinone biosynthesis C-methylase UbiE